VTSGSIGPDRATIGVIGTGNMGSAFVKGWLLSPEPKIDIVVWDKVSASSQSLLVSETVTQAGSLADLVERADVVLVVVKPKDAGDLLGSVAGLLRSEQTVISAMAGLTLEWMRSVLGPGPALYRIMPNLGVELGVGAVALSAEPGASEARTRMVMGLLEPLGLVEAVSEDMLDAVTAVSGSGPAFLALVVEGLEDGAVAAGLPRAAARSLVRQAAVATAKLLPLYGDSPAELRRHLTESGSFDQAGLDVLDDREVRSAFRQAVEAALERSKALRGAGQVRSASQPPEQGSQR
jgi:pyrroline-5-carboxylate reductase